jgi:hypothetical protein
MRGQSASANPQAARQGLAMGVIAHFEAAPPFASEIPRARSQFRDVVAQGRKIGGEIFRFTARHICSPVLRGMTVHGYAWDNAVCV